MDCRSVAVTETIITIPPDVKNKPGR